MNKKIKYVSAVLIAAFAIGFVIAKMRTIRPEAASLKKREQVLNEMFSTQLSIRYPRPDPAETILAYIDDGSDKGVKLLDLQSLEQRLVKVKNEIIQIYGWSPGSRYLAFAQNPRHLDDSWLSIYDRQSNSVQRLTSMKGVLEFNFVWLGTNSYLFTSRGLKATLAEFYLGSINGPQSKLCNYTGEVVAMAEKKIGYAYAYQKNGIEDIYSLSFDTPESAHGNLSNTIPEPARLSAFKKNGFSALQWLRYSQESSNFLFCARPKKSKWRYLFEFNPATKKLTQLTTSDTYNGQWLQKGNGFVCVINTNNSFQLAVRPKNTGENTNLFVKGGVLSYAASPGGDHIYIVASEGLEPHGIWEYNVTNQVLRQLVDGFKKQFVASRIVPPVDLRIKSFDGVEIHSFLFSPAQLTNDARSDKTNEVSPFHRQMKYPAVIYVPPASYQFQRSFNVQSQTFANLGFYFTAINYRGCDGYGTEFSKLADTKNAAKDVLALYEDLVKNPNIDKENIFLSTSSAGAAVVFELLATAPERWRAVALDKPSIYLAQDLTPEKLPPLLVIAGGQDPAFPSIQNFISWALDHNVEIASVIHTNSGHITYNVSDLKDTQSKMDDFFISHLKK